MTDKQDHTQDFVTSGMPQVIMPPVVPAKLAIAPENMPVGSPLPVMPKVDPYKLKAGLSGRQLNSAQVQEADAMREHARIVRQRRFRKNAEVNEAMRTMRRNNADVVYDFFNGKLDDALATVAALSRNPAANSAQLSAALFIIRTASISVEETISRIIDLSEFDDNDVPGKINRVNELYAAGVLTATEHSTMMAGLNSQDKAITKELSESVKQLEESEAMRLAEEKARSGSS